MEFWVSAVDYNTTDYKSHLYVNLWVSDVYRAVRATTGGLIVRSLLLVLCSVLLTACGESSLRCEKVEQGAVKLIEAGFEEALKERPELGLVAAHKSTETRPNGGALYFVSAEIVDNGVATWVMSFIDGASSLIIAMPGLAEDLTVYPNASKTAWKFSETDYGFRQSRECLELLGTARQPSE